MNKMMKIAVCILCVVSMVLGLGGCQIVMGVRKVAVTKYVEKSTLSDEEALGTGLGAAGAQQVEEPKLSGTLKMQVFTNESGAHSEAWTNVVTAFEEQTGIKVTLIMGSQVNTQYSAAWLAGESPADIVWIAGNGIADEEMEKSGMFYDLTAFLEEATVYGTDAKITDRINQNVITPYNGGIYRIPLMNSTQGMWYDAGLIEKAPVNFDEYMQLAEELEADGIAGMTYPGMYSDYLMWALIMPAVAAYGEEFFVQVASGQPDAFLDERFQAVLTRYKQYCDAGHLMKGSVSADHTTSQLNWLNNKAGFITNGLWLEAEMAEYIPAGFQMRFCASPLIEKEQKPTMVVHGNDIAVSAKTENLENALAFIRFMYREDVQLEYMSKYSYLSALKDLSYEDAELTDVARSTLDYFFSDQVDVINCNVNWTSLLNNTFKQVVNDLASGNMTVEQACQALHDDAKR